MGFTDSALFARTAVGVARARRVAFVRSCVRSRVSFRFARLRAAVGFGFIGARRARDGRVSRKWRFVFQDPKRVAPRLLRLASCLYFPTRRRAGGARAGEDADAGDGDGARCGARAPGRAGAAATARVQGAGRRWRFVCGRLTARATTRGDARRWRANTANAR